MRTKKQTVKSSRKPVVKHVKDDKKPKMVSFGRAFVNFFRKYIQFSGTATRAEYWWMWLWLLVIIIATGLFAFVLVTVLLALFKNLYQVETIIIWVTNILCVGWIIPWYALMARRLHDVGVTAQILWISAAFNVYTMLIPTVVPNILVITVLNYIWSICMFVLFLLPSKTKNNPYRD